MATTFLLSGVKLELIKNWWSLRNREELLRLIAEQQTFSRKSFYEFMDGQFLKAFARPVAPVVAKHQRISGRRCEMQPEKSDKTGASYETDMFLMGDCSFYCNCNENNDWYVDRNEHAVIQWP